MAPNRGKSQWDSAAVIEVEGLDEPLARTKPTTLLEDEAIHRAVDDFESLPTLPDGEFLAPFEAYLAAHPNSGWTPVLQTNLGLAYYRLGYFTRAFAAWTEAWRNGREANDLPAKAIIDRAVGELARMHARVGHADELKILLNDIGERSLTGSATELITGAREGEWEMRTNPGNAFLCGPKALGNVLDVIGAAPSVRGYVDNVQSGRQGFTLEQVGQLADNSGLPHRLIHRLPGQAVPVPSVINWRVNHYAAIVSESNGSYHIKDPTFGGDLIVSRRAIDEESTGYFLAPVGDADDAGWREVSLEEAATVRGMGFTSASDDGGTSGDDDTTGGNCGDSTGMCVPNAHAMLVSLNLTDTPVGYAPQKGPAVYFRISYNQREAGQPAAPAYTNLGPKWTFNMLSFVQDMPASSPGMGVSRYLPGGGYRLYTNYSSPSGTFAAEMKTGDRLSRSPATGTASSYTLSKADGSRLVYQTAGTTSNGVRRVFLTYIYDASGNRLELGYNAQRRLTQITDASGRISTISYSATCPNNISRFTDPFGRVAAIEYDPACRLTEINDAIGLRSSVTYDQYGYVKSLSTPYGTSRFAYSVYTGSGTTPANNRWLEITDPTGFTERLEFSHDIGGAWSEAAPAGMPVTTFYLGYRNSYFWNKYVYPLYGTGSSKDYRKAKIWHWLHTAAAKTSTLLESEKKPLEARVWYAYPGQSNPYYEGTSGQPMSVGRVLDDGSSQVWQYTHNSVGNLLSKIDPVGRKTKFIYDSDNPIDLRSIRQMTSGYGTSNEVYSTITEYLYNSFHKIARVKDPAWQEWNFTYNASGQITSAVEPTLLATTSYEYDSSGRFWRSKNVNGVYVVALGYATCGGTSKINCELPSNVTDSEGRTVSYRYDHLDRITRIEHPSGTEQFNYTNLDLTSYIDRKGRVTTYTYDANRRLKSVTKPGNRIVRYDYYPDGSLKTLTDERNNVTTWTIDVQGRPVSKIFADGSIETYTYDGAGRLEKVTDALSRSKNYEYNVDDTIDSVWYEGTNRSYTASFEYDQYFSRRTSITDGAPASTFFTYVPLGAPGALSLESETTSGLKDVSYTYDDHGRVRSTTAGGFTDTWSYDLIGRRSRHITPIGTFDYTFLGQTSLPKTRTLTGKNATITWDYALSSSDRRLKSITSEASGRVISYGYQEQLTGQTDYYQVQSMSVADGGTTDLRFANWDASLRLTRFGSATKPSIFAYDPSSNLTTLTNYSRTISGALTDNPPVMFTYNILNQLQGTFPTGGQPNFDMVGNQLSGEGRGYAWNTENRLTNVAWEDGSPVVSLRLTYVHDGLGRRSMKIRNNRPGAEFYTWCGDTLCAKYDNFSGETIRYLEEGQVSTVSGKRLAYLKDHLGNIRETYNVDSGQVVKYEYSPYGDVGSSAGFNDPPPDLAFAGMFWDNDARLYFSSTRAYDPRLGRWLSRDTVGEFVIPGMYSAFGLPNAVFERGLASYDGGRSPVTSGWNFSDMHDVLVNVPRSGSQANLYAYVDGDPLNYNDPSGQFGLVGALGGCVIGAVYGAWAGAGGAFGSEDGHEDAGDAPKCKKERDDGRNEAALAGAAAGCLTGGLAGATGGLGLGFHGAGLFAIGAGYGGGYVGGRYSR